MMVILELLIWACAALTAAESVTHVDDRQKPFRNTVTLGGLFSLHSASEEPGKCSPEFSLRGVKRFTAMEFAAKRINADHAILPNVTLEVKLFDTCESTSAALERTLKEFVFGYCPDGKCSCAVRQPVVGVVGPASSAEAVYIARALEVFKIPVISYGATSPELSDKSRYEYFSRTAPSNIHQVKAIVDLLVHLNWTYISVVYTDEPYGRSGFEQLKKESSTRGICIAVEGKLPVHYDKARYQSVINALHHSNQSTEIVVLFLSSRAYVPLLDDMEKLSSSFQNMQFIASSGAEFTDLDDAEYWSFTKGMIVVRYKSKQLKEFKDYFGNQTLSSNEGSNTWFTNFYQQQFNCTVAGRRNQSTPLKATCNANQPLRTLSALNRTYHVAEEYVIDAVYAFAHAFDKILRSSCEDDALNCGRLDNVSGEVLLHTLRNVSFTSITGKKFQFNSDGDVNGGYDIFYLQGNEPDEIGEWEGQLRMKSALAWPQKFKFVKSRCSEPCGAHEIQSRLPGKPSCCWICEQCAVNAFVLNKTKCRDCERGYLPGKNQETCVKIPPLYYTVDGNALSVSLVVPPLFLSGVGILAVIFTACVLAKFRNTALVKASSRELCFLLLLGLLLSNLYPFVCIMKPSRFTCLSQFIFGSLPTTMSYVAVAVKTNRVFRIFDEERIITNRPSMVSSRSQILLSLGLIFFQCLFLLALGFLDFPTTELVYFSSTQVHLVCSKAVERTLLSNFCNMFLMIVCTYYAYKVRNIPRNFNEARHIAFAMYGASLISITFIVVHFVSAKVLNEILRLAIYCYSSSLQSSVLFTCFFARKVHIMLFHPEHNINYPTFNNKLDESRMEEAHSENAPAKARP